MLCRASLSQFQCAGWNTSSSGTSLNTCNSVLERACINDGSNATQADDRKFKEELGRVIEMDIWEQAKAVAAERLKAAKGEGARLEHELHVRQDWLQGLKEQASYLVHPPDRA